MWSNHAEHLRCYEEYQAWVAKRSIHHRQLTSPAQQKGQQMEDTDLTKPRYRLFLKGTIDGEYEPHPSARFYHSMEQAEARAVDLIESGTINEPIVIFESVKVIAPKPKDVVSFNVRRPRARPQVAKRSKATRKR